MLKRSTDPLQFVWKKRTFTTVTYVVEYSYTGTNLRSDVICLHIYFFSFSSSLVREGKKIKQITAIKREGMIADYTGT